ncbi:hypothetical protein SAMD00019534_055240, partial [Acytostelium subglobosum LB1]|uniref:hypothetical protein n=1 Tax=Acytostelium subglobosum LB1 TaxID=1410327 RepID=UPI0006450C50
YVESLSRSKAPQGSFKSIRLNDIIVCNHTSYIDIIYLTYRYSPIFCIPPNDKQSAIEGRLIPLSIAGALSNAIFSPMQLSGQSVPTSQVVQRINSSWSGPVIVLPEGTTSNGSGLLDIQPVFVENNNLLVDHFHVIGITYPTSTSTSPSYTVGNYFLHLLKVCAVWRHEIIVRYLSRNCVPSLPLDGSSGPVDTQDVIEWFDALFKSLSSMINCRRTKITANQKLSFVAYWRGYSSNYSNEKKT